MNEPGPDLAGLPPGTAGFVDHIGIAVTDLDAALTLWRDLLGLEVERLEEVPSEHVRVAFLSALLQMLQIRMAVHLPGDGGCR